MCHDQITHDLPANRLCPGSSSPWHPFQCCSHPLALLITLLTPLRPCSDPSSSWVVLVLKAWIMQPPFSCLIFPVLQPRILLPLPPYFIMADASVMSKSSSDFWLAWVDLAFWWEVSCFLPQLWVIHFCVKMHCVCMTSGNLYCSAPKTYPLPYVIVPSLCHLQTSIGMISYIFLSWIWRSWTKSTTCQMVTLHLQYCFLKPTS